MYYRLTVKHVNNMVEPFKLYYVHINIPMDPLRAKYLYINQYFTILYLAQISNIPD